MTRSIVGVSPSIGRLITARGVGEEGSLTLAAEKRLHTAQPSLSRQMRDLEYEGSGSIINISSTYGHEGAAGASIYAGAKHAVEGITKSVALEIAKSGIRVNAVAPGPTDTGMLTRFTGTPENKAALTTTVPMGRLGLSDELASAIAFIASDEASFITGQVLNVDGGKSR